MFPFASGDVLMGNGNSVGLCTLWTPKEKYISQMPYVMALGNLYTRFGIAFIIRNVLATPSIRTVVVTGIDNPEQKRRQAQALLKGQFEPSELFLEVAHVEEFYRRTKLVDARDIPVREQGEVTSLIVSLREGADFDLPQSILVPMPEVSKETYPTYRSGHILRAASIRKAHLDILKEIRLFGEYTQPDSEGHLRQELWQLTTCLTSDCSFDSIPLYEDDEVLRYGEALWNGDEPEELTYRYGHTLRRRYGDQIEATITAFREKPETFRTVLSLWEPLESMRRNDEPCLVLVHPRLRNHRLDMYAYIRTNEMFRGWPKNAAGLRYLQSKLANELSSALGELTITSGSAHVYDRDWAAVDSFLAANRQRSTIQFDEKGDWRFSKSAEGYVAEHSKDGILLQRFAENSISRLERRVLPFIGDVSHAVYIGRELERLAVATEERISAEEDSNITP